MRPISKSRSSVNPASKVDSCIQFPKNTLYETQHTNFCMFKKKKQEISTNYMSSFEQRDPGEQKVAVGHPKVG